MSNDPVVHHQDVFLSLPEASLEGFLAVPEGARGLVIFAHGSGSSRFSRRNVAVANTLNRAGLATLLFDLLSADEGAIDAGTLQFRFDIPLLTGRVVAAVDWAAGEPVLAKLRIGLFGASTGAAAALGAAARRPAQVAAVVSRGGRPDLAGEALPRVLAPTLLIVGGFDTEVIDLNRLAAEQMTAIHVLEIVPHASHLFEEPGTLEQAAALARDWFVRYLAGAVSGKGGPEPPGGRA